MLQEFFLYLWKTFFIFVRNFFLYLWENFSIFVRKFFLYLWENNYICGEGGERYPKAQHFTLLLLTDFLLLKMFSIAFHISLYFSHRSSIPIKEDMVLALSKCLTYPFIRGVKMHNEYFHRIIVLFTWIPSFEKCKFCFSVSITQNLKKSLSKFEIILGRPYLFNPTKICLGFLHLTPTSFFHYSAIQVFFLEDIHDYYMTNQITNHVTNHMIIIRQVQVFKYHVNSNILSFSTLVE